MAKRAVVMMLALVIAVSAMTGCGKKKEEAAAESTAMETAAEEEVIAHGSGEEESAVQEAKTGSMKEAPVTEEEGLKRVSDVLYGNRDMEQYLEVIESVKTEEEDGCFVAAKVKDGCLEDLRETAQGLMGKEQDPPTLTPPFSTDTVKKYMDSVSMKGYYSAALPFADAGLIKLEIYVGEKDGDTYFLMFAC